MSVHNILILGGGISGTRFVESYLFSNNINMNLASFSVKNKTQELAKKYGIFCQDFCQYKDFNKFDCIIVSVPYFAKQKVLQAFVDNKYNGVVIIEKPFALTKKDFNIFSKMLADRNVVIPLSRRFFNNEIFRNVEYDDYIKIKWPMYNLQDANIYIDLLPHCVDWINMLLNSVDTLEVKTTDKKFIMYRQNGIDILIEFIECHNERNIVVNDKEYPWIDLFSTNNKIIEKVFFQNKGEREEIYDYLYLDTIVLEKILEYRG